MISRSAVEALEEIGYGGYLAMEIGFNVVCGKPMVLDSEQFAENLSITLSLYGFDQKSRRSTWRRVGLLTVQQSTKEDR